MKKSLLYYLLLLVSVTANGQDVFVKAEGPSAVNAGEQFTVMWTVNSGGGEFSAPSFNGFYKLMGPETSYSSSTQIINGKMSNETSYSYVYYLQAVKEGKYVLSPATFTLKGKTYSSDSIHIEVVGSTSPNKAQHPLPGVTLNRIIRTWNPQGEIFLLTFQLTEKRFILVNLLLRLSNFTRVLIF